MFVRTDAELTQAWTAGDERAGYELYKRHASAVVRFFRNKVPESDLDDLLQSTFMKCFEHGQRYSPDASFRAFLLGFARNILLHHYRSFARKHAKIDFGVTSVHALGLSPSGAFARDQQEQRLLAALRGLAIEHQILLELFYWEDMGGRELAEVFGVAEGTIRTRLRRARSLLLAALDELESSGKRVELGETGINTWAQKVRRQFGETKEE